MGPAHDTAQAAEVFGGLRVVPDRLTDAGFRFEHPDVGSALRDAMRSGVAV
ncbi:MAG: DUF1731 domain-containing protein [Streptomycetales bacterium]